MDHGGHILAPMPWLPPSDATLHRDGLARLLGTHDVHAFLRNDLGEQMLFQTGSADRWADLFSWGDLNALLNKEVLPYPTVRLIKGGKPIDLKTYTHTVDGRHWPDSVLCQRRMAEGATLIVQRAERLSPRLDAFINSLKRELNARITSDVVVTCAKVAGLNMHWDAYECFNLQLDGEKAWQVKKPIRPYPLRTTKGFPRPDVAEEKIPEGEPAWSGVMTPGSMIYLPRGWWHGVTPTVVPSMHLSIAVDMPTIADFLAWSLPRIMERDLVRKPIPCWDTESVWREFSDEVLASALPDLSSARVQEYLAHLNTLAPEKAEFSLPNAAAPEASAFKPTTGVRLRPTWLPYVVDNGSLRCEWRGMPFEFSSRVLPAVEKLNSARSCTFEQLCVGADRLLVTALVMTLSAAGVVAVVNELPQRP